MFTSFTWTGQGTRTSGSHLGLLRTHSQALGVEDVLPGPSMGQDSCWVSSDLFWSSTGKPDICQDIAWGIKSLPWSS